MADRSNVKSFRNREVKNRETRSRIDGDRKPRARARKKRVLRAYSMDYVILFLVLFLVGFGLVMIYSTSSYKAGLYHQSSGYWLIKQARVAAIGVVLMLIITRIDYHIWNSRDILFYIYYGGTAALLIFTLLFALAKKGSKRWIGFGGLSFQPSEMAKVALILILAIYLSDHIRQLQTWKGIFTAFAMVAPLVILVGVENLSTGVILLGITVVMIFVSTPLYKPFGLLAGIAGVGIGILLMAASYRVERFKTWFHPESSSKGMQTMQGLYAIGSGGLFGKGLGQSMQKMGFLPETHNDMIFSIICEELGLFGAICIILIYLILLWRFLTVAMRAPDLFGSFIVVGAIAHIGIQVFINIGVVTNTLPNTGVPLPFISYGGTSMIFLLVEMGLVLSVSRYTR